MRRTSIFLAIALSLLSSAAGAGPAETCNHPAVRSEIQRQMEERLAKRERRVFRLQLAKVDLATATAAERFRCRATARVMFADESTTTLVSTFTLAVEGKKLTVRHDG